MFIKRKNIFIKEIIICSFFFLIIEGCDIFSTRDEELPEEGRANFQVATTIDILIQNFTNSLADKNTQNYIACFSSPTFTNVNFSFIPSAEAVSQFPSLASDWTLKNEEQYLNNVISKIDIDSPIRLTLTNMELSPQGDSATYSANYFLYVPHNDVSIPKDFEGGLNFSLIRDSRNVWTISKWQDIKFEGKSSWSELKGMFY